jgi:hypothetical protein
VPGLRHPAGCHGKDAAEEGRSLVVKYVCQQSQKQRQSRRARPGSAATARLAGLLSSILNAQDINGDTALSMLENLVSSGALFGISRCGRCLDDCSCNCDP